MASKTHRLLTNAADTNMVFNQDLEEEYTERERKQTGETNKDINLENISKQSIFKKQQTYEHDNKKENDEMGRYMLKENMRFMPINLFDIMSKI